MRLFALPLLAMLACGGSPPPASNAPAPSASVVPELAPDDEATPTPPGSPKDKCAQPPCWGPH